MRLNTVAAFANCGHAVAHVRGGYVPLDSCSAATTCAAACLFDHLVGAGADCWWNFEPKCLCGLEIDDEIELRRLHDW